MLSLRTDNFVQLSSVPKPDPSLRLSQGTTVMPLVTIPLPKSTLMPSSALSIILARQSLNTNCNAINDDLMLMLECNPWDHSTITEDCINHQSPIHLRHHPQTNLRNCCRVNLVHCPVVHIMIHFISMMMKRVRRHHQ